MTDIINNFIQSTELNLLTAFLLGLIVAVNPCQVAICLSAMAVMLEREDGKHLMRKTLVFVSGRAILYFGLGIILLLLYKGAGLAFDKVYSDTLSQWVEMLMPYLTIVLALFFIFRALHHHHHSGSCHNSGNIIRKNKNIGIFLMGVLLALIFCPESAVLYFGVMMPMATASNWSILLIAVFAISAVIPIVAFASICTFSIKKTHQWERKLERIQFLINLVSGILLLIMGVLLFFI